jgi:hypothetical protein
MNKAVAPQSTMAADVWLNFPPLKFTRIRKCEDSGMDSMIVFMVQARIESYKEEAGAVNRLLGALAAAEAGTLTQNPDRGLRAEVPSCLGAPVGWR